MDSEKIAQETGLHAPRKPAPADLRKRTLAGLRTDPRLGDWSLDAVTIQWIADNFQIGAKILELGAGRGTLVLRDLGYEVISVEHDEHWARKIGREEGGVIYAPQGTDGWYQEQYLEGFLPDDYDLLIVDGPVGADRLGFIHHVNVFGDRIRHVPVLFDDSHRPEVATMAEQLAEQLGRQVIYKRGPGKSFAVLTMKEQRARIQPTSRPGHAVRQQVEKPMVVFLLRGEWTHANYNQELDDLFFHLRINRGWRVAKIRKWGPNPDRLLANMLSDRRPWPHPDTMPFEHEPHLRRYHRIVIIDSDQSRGNQPNGWIDVFERLYAADKDIISPLIYDRNGEYVHYYWDSSVPYEQRYLVPPVKRPSDTIQGSDPVQVASVGFGWTMIKPGVLEQIGAPWFLRIQPGPNPYKPLGYYGCDVAFCLNAAEVGYQAWVHPNTVVGHMKIQDLSPTPMGMAK